MPKQQINYTNTIIYKIVFRDITTKETYVGHTTDFTKRKYAHKTICNNEKSKSYNFNVYQFIRQNGGWDNWTMIEIEKYCCVDRIEAVIEKSFYREIESKIK